MLKFIASGVFGSTAFQEGLLYSMIGLGLHYIIALGWTVFFFLTYPRIPLLSKNAILTGIGYGIVVWMGMNFVVLPLSNIPTLGPMSVKGVLTGASVLIVCIGFPLSFIASVHFKHRESCDKDRIINKL